MPISVNRLYCTQKKRSEINVKKSIFTRIAIKRHFFISLLIHTRLIYILNICTKSRKIRDFRFFCVLPGQFSKIYHDKEKNVQGGNDNLIFLFHTMRDVQYGMVT